MGQHSGAWGLGELERGNATWLQTQSEGRELVNQNL